MRFDLMIRQLPIAISCALAPILVGGCDALDVSNPTVIEDSNLNDAAGAELLRKAAVSSLYGAHDLAAYNAGMMADEFTYDISPNSERLGTKVGANLLDRRESDAYESLPVSSTWHNVRTAANIALSKARRYSVAARVGELLAVRGFATLRLAEDYCPGFPLHNVSDYNVTHTAPLSTEQVIRLAVADFDSALVHAADSVRILDLARVFRGRAFLGLGQYAEAAAAVRDVPTDFRQNAGPGTTLGDLSKSSASVSNREGGTGLDFIEAQDPRLPLRKWGNAYDGVTPMYSAALYPVGTPPVMPLATGIEARLIEAEAALREGGNWLQILNSLRTRVPGLAPLTDPGVAEARVDLLFRERAFWLFGTGSRLADLRRLISQYGRASEMVFPTGAHWRSGVYGTATSIPFNSDLVKAQVPSVTGCISR